MTKKDLEKAFYAGRIYGYDYCLAQNDGLPPAEPDFEEWYENYKKTKDVLD